MDDLNPGIRNVVKWLNEQGLTTCDSGDGQTHDHECDRDYPYVVIVSQPDRLVSDACMLRALLGYRGIEIQPQAPGVPCIQATFDPANGTALIDLMGVRW